MMDDLMIICASRSSSWSSVTYYEGTSNIYEQLLNPVAIHPANPPAFCDLCTSAKHSPLISIKQFL